MKRFNYVLIYTGVRAPCASAHFYGSLLWIFFYRVLKLLKITIECYRVLSETTLAHPNGRWYN